MKTHTVKKKDVQRSAWHVLDADDQVLGRVATQVSSLLMGKGKTNYSSHINVGDKVVVINCGKLRVTGKKEETKPYYRHSGYPGGLKTEIYKDVFEKKPEEVLKKAVWGMLPVNKLRKQRILNLYLYKGEEHPHKAQSK